MRRDNVNYLAVGLFVVIAIGAFAILMYRISGRAGPTDQYYTYYHNVAGLKFGTGVYYEGYRVGQVERIEPAPSAQGMRYKLTLSITQGWQIPKDSVAQVTSYGLIAAVQIEIKEGASTELLKPQQEIAGNEQQDLFASLNRAASKFNALSENGVLPVLDNLNSRITQVADEILEFRQQELSPFVAKLNTKVNDDLIKRSESVLDKLDASAQSLQRILGAENEQQAGNFLLHLNEVAVNLNDLVSRIEATRVQMNQVLNALGGLVANNDEDIRGTVQGARASLQQMESALTTINERIDTVMYHLEGSASDVHELTRSLRENPARLVRGTPPAAKAPPP